jgi:hypothetical protein
MHVCQQGVRHPRLRQLAGTAQQQQTHQQQQQQQVVQRQVVGLQERSEAGAASTAAQQQQRQSPGTHPQQVRLILPVNSKQGGLTPHRSAALQAHLQLQLQG